MRKILILLLTIFITCGTTDDEVNELIDEAVDEVTSTTATLRETTATTKLVTTSTTSTTTTTTIPLPQKTIVVLEINVNHPNTKIKDVRDAIACVIDRNHVNENILANVPVGYNSLIPPDFAVDKVESVYTNKNCTSKNYSENFISATNILKKQFTATSWFDGVRCTINEPCIVENLSLRDSNVSPNFTTERLKLYSCGPGSDPLMSTWSLFTGDFISRLGMPTAAFSKTCISVSFENQQSKEYLSKLNNSCDSIATAPFRISKITIDNLYNYFKSLTEKQADVCYGMHFTNFTNQIINDNLAILKEDVNNIEAARNIEKELLTNNVIIPLYIISNDSLQELYERYLDEKNALEEELKNIDSDSDRAYDVNIRLTELNTLLQGGEEKLTYFIPTD